ncbi:hypothetical protein BKP35_08995 [Anaerobacillus arseniciselenatis]|uniref:Uncharacterized protein n=1 Tax=Anaerobacillus arseniciselenatis TaxID=85682 RepID=A0A1S2LLM5_9BACI|nr:hypothetical protein [Anaerobacillus arseniciselenatis]OIJ13361.1 hypothetical protein BKP35_08995 [Anaerobacillus arseniciselenatis]
MLEKEIVKQKLVDLFGNGFVAETIYAAEKKVLTLIDTSSDYVIVSISDFTDFAIGDYDVFIESRIKKTDNHLKDMANIIGLLQMDTVSNVEKVQKEIKELTDELTSVSKGLSKRFVLSTQTIK